MVRHIYVAAVAPVLLFFAAPLCASRLDLRLRSSVQEVEPWGAALVGLVTLFLVAGAVVATAVIAAEGLREARGWRSWSVVVGLAVGLVSAMLMFVVDRTAVVATLSTSVAVTGIMTGLYVSLCLARLSRTRKGENVPGHASAGRYS